MVRKIWDGFRHPARRLKARLTRWRHTHSSRPHQLLPNIRIPRWSSLTNYFRRGRNGPRRLHARIVGIIKISLALFMLDESLDPYTRRKISLEKIKSIVDDKNWENSRKKLYVAGEALLAEYSGAEVKNCGKIRISNTGNWLGKLEVLVYTAPDPDVEDGVLVLGLGTLGKDEEGLVDETDVFSMDALAIELEAFARRLPEPLRTRGGVAILLENRTLAMYSWDGREWWIVIFTDWDMPEPTDI
ncbi:hypothetical protein GGS21DRAFT_532663 [Xylaria nigripes]|nr:hypothetical protein GGS21DRAFT_532663 [Xylaria nigripes]